MKRRSVYWLIGVLLLLGASGFLYARFGRGPAAAPIQYKTAPIVRKRIVGRVTASGSLSATVTVQVGSQVSGRVQKIFVDFNSPAKKGQIIAKIDPLLFQAAVEQSEANYLSAKASLERAKAQALDADRQFTRAKALFAEKLASQQDLETAETAAKVARATIDVSQASLGQAQAALNQARSNLSYTNIISPIDGTVISRNVDVGQTVAASLQAPVLFTIAEDLRKMQVNTNIAEGDVGRLQPGMDTFFTVDAYPGQRFRGTIRQIRNAPQTVQNVVTYDAVIDVDNSDLRLRPGMTANVTVTYAERDDALAVPNAALRFRPPPELSPSASARRGPRPLGSAGARAGGGNSAGDSPSESRTVWVLRGEMASPLQVQTGLSDGTVSELTKGELKESDLVIVDATVTGKPAGGTGGGPNPMRMF